MSLITDALIDSLTESEDFIDKLFANEYFREKLFKLIGNKTKLDNCANLENVLWIDRSEYEFISSYEEFIGLSESDIKKLYQSNDFVVYKNFIKQACLEGKIKSSHLVNPDKYKVTEIFTELIHSNQTIPNIFEPIINLELNIAYTLIQEYYYPKHLDLDQIFQISGTKTIDEFYDRIPDCKRNPRFKKELFVRTGVLVNYLKDAQVNSQYVKKLLDDYLQYYPKRIDYFVRVYEKYSYSKIPLGEVLVWFEISGSDAPKFKKQTYSVSLSYSNDIKPTMKNFFEKVCTSLCIVDVSNPDYIKYTQIINWLNTK